MPEREGQSAAAAAAERVRAILEAAEQTAASLEAEAREGARQIRAAAESDAASAREAVGRLGERADALERRLDELADGVKAAVAGLKEELGELREGTAAPAVDDETIAEAEAVAAREPELSGGDEEPEAGEPKPSAPEGARVLALKMALDGTPREETARYLQENFELDDPDTLLDEVYAKAGR
jgi:hypothetical protein